jgi:uncharacterized protein YrrD
MIDPTGSITGATLVDDHEDKVGTITDVIVDNATLEPHWAVVRYGMRRHHTLVPVEELFPRDEGTVMTHLDRDFVHAAPRFKGDVPDVPESREAERYYHHN